MRGRENDPQYHLYLGNSYKKKGMIDEAISCYEKSLMLNPQSPQVLNNLGNALREKEKFDEAIRCYEMALKINPEYINAQNNIGFTYLEIAEFDKAITCFDALLKMCPECAEAHNNQGVALRETGQFNEALNSFKRAIQFNPDLEDAHQNLSALYLLLGNFQDGWREYRWFWNLRGPYHDLQKPLWDGSDIKGKILLLHAGAGFGDTIQFIRYVPMIKERGASVIIGCQKEIGSLLKGVEGIEQVIIEGERLPHFDVQSSMFRLPIIFDTKIDSIPNKVPYITVIPQLVGEWKEKVILDKHSFRIGLTWAGGHRIGIYCHRTFPPELFSGLSNLKNAAFYSLQIGGQRDEIQGVLRDLNLIDFTGDIKDFSDTAALIENLDLIISIDTSVAHLAGALGKPVWTLLPYVPDWRWMLNRDDSPWYPTMRLFRQPSPGDWNSVISKLHNELEKRITEKTFYDEC
jgi:tetratricopeptide (TPR) repeat protein